MQEYTPTSSNGAALISKKLSYVADIPFLNTWVVMKEPSLARLVPSFLQITFIAGEPVEVQFSVSAALLPTSCRELT